MEEKIFIIALRFCNMYLGRNCFVDEDEFHLLVIQFTMNFGIFIFQIVWTNSYATTRLFYDIMSESRSTFVKSLITYLV